MRDAETQRSTAAVAAELLPPGLVLCAQRCDFRLALFRWLSALLGSSDFSSCRASLSSGGSTRSFTDIRLCFVSNFGDLTPTHGPVRPLHSGVNGKEVTGAPRRLLRHQLRCDRGGSSGEGSGINVGRTRTRSSAHGQCVLGSVRHRAAARLPAGASGVFKCEYWCVRCASGR